MKIAETYELTIYKRTDDPDEDAPDEYKTYTVGVDGVTGIELGRHKFARINYKNGLCETWSGFPMHWKTRRLEHPQMDK